MVTYWGNQFKEKAIPKQKVLFLHYFSFSTLLLVPCCVLPFLRPPCFPRAHPLVAGSLRTNMRVSPCQPRATRLRPATSPHKPHTWLKPDRTQSWNLIPLGNHRMFLLPSLPLHEEVVSASGCAARDYGKPWEQRSPWSPSPISELFSISQGWGLGYIFFFYLRSSYICMLS